MGYPFSPFVDSRCIRGSPVSGSRVQGSRGQSVRPPVALGTNSWVFARAWRRGLARRGPRPRVRTSATALRVPRATCRAIIVDVAAPTPWCARECPVRSGHARLFSRDRVGRLETGPRMPATTRLPRLPRLRATRRGARHSRERLRVGHRTRLGARATERGGDLEPRAFVSPCPPPRVGARPRAWVLAVRLRRVAMPRKTRASTCACSGSRRVRRRARRPRPEGTPRNSAPASRAPRARGGSCGRSPLAPPPTNTTSPTPRSRSRKRRTTARPTKIFHEKRKHPQACLPRRRRRRARARPTSRAASRPCASPSAPSRARRRSRSSSTSGAPRIRSALVRAALPSGFQARSRRRAGKRTLEEAFRRRRREKKKLRATTTLHTARIKKSPRGPRRNAPS